MNVDSPDFWQERYAANNTPWDTNTTTPALVESVDNLVSKKIAILGCGYSRDSFFLAKKKHSVYSIDFAPKPIAYLESVKKKYYLNNLHPIQEDIFNLSIDYLNFFDIILEYTCFCAIPTNRRIDYVNLVSKVLNKDGVFIGLFFPILRKKGMGDGPPFYVDLDKTISMFESKFNIIHIDKNPNSIKPRQGFEALVKMIKK